MVYTICFLPVIIIGLVNVHLVKLTKKNFGEVLPFTLMLMILVEYLSQIIWGTFTLSSVLIGGVAALAVPILIANRKDEELLCRIKTVGLWSFLIISVLFWVFDLRRSFSTWDEFSHWGKMIKEMLRLDSFYVAEEARLLIHKDYPPFVQLFEMFWCKFSGGYSESRVSLAVHILEFSLVVPYSLEKAMVNKRQLWRQLLSSILLLAVFILIIIGFDTYGHFPTIYLDIIMPLFYVLGLNVVLYGDKQDRGPHLICILMIQASILLTKQIGIAFGMLIWLTYTMQIVADKWEGNKLINSIKKIAMSLCVIVVPYIVSQTWTRYVKRFGIKGQFDLSQINVANIFDILYGNDITYRHEVFESYIYEIFHNNVSAGIVPFTYVGATAFTVVGILFAYFIRKRIFTKECSFFCINVIVGSIGYAATILMLYLFCFSEYEATGLASFKRYMNSFVMAEILILAIVVIKLFFVENEHRMTLWFEIVTVLLLFVLSNGTRLIRMMWENYTYEAGTEYMIMSEMIEANVNSGEKIICASTNNVTNVYHINYYLNDTVMDEKFLYTDISSLVPDDYNWDLVMEQLRKNRFLYVVNATDELNDSLGYLVDDIGFKDRMLYEYCYVGDSEMLVEVK